MQAIESPPATSAAPPADPALADIVRRAGSGEQDAWHQLVTLYSRRIYALALSRLHSTHAAEDLTQSVFTTLAEQLTTDRYTETGRFEPWLFRIANNRIRDEAKRKQRAPKQLPEHNHATSANPNHPDDEQLTALRNAMHQLTTNEQELLTLRHHAQMSFKEIATLLDEPLGTLLARHHRALNKLRELLSKTEHLP